MRLHVEPGRVLDEDAEHDHQDDRREQCPRETEDGLVVPDPDLTQPEIEDHMARRPQGPE